MKHIPILHNDDYPSSYYQPLFNLMQEHGLILLEGEMQEIIDCVNKMQESEAFDLIKHLERQKEFSLKAFGPELFRYFGNSCA